VRHLQLTIPPPPPVCSLAIPLTVCIDASNSFAMAWAGDLVSNETKDGKLSSHREESLRVLLDLSLLRIWRFIVWCCPQFF